MKITIPRCATWPPRFWDTTNPVRHAEAVAYVRSLITEDERPSFQNEAERWKAIAIRALSDQQNELSIALDEAGRRLADQALSSPRSDAGAVEAPRDHPNQETENNGLSSWESLRIDVLKLQGIAQELGRTDWPPPKPGTHESDLGRTVPLVVKCGTRMPWELNAADDRKHGWMEFAKAQRWSERNRPTPNNAGRQA